MPEQKKEMGFFDHLAELRRRLLWSFLSIVVGSIIAYSGYDIIIRVLTAPFTTIPKQNAGLFITSIFEGFSMKIQISLLGGLIIASPIYLFHLLRFVFPGLKSAERKVVGVSLAFSLLLALSSFYISFCRLVPFTVHFMTSSGFVPEKVGLLLHFSQNILYVVQLVFYAMLLFQIPVIFLVLMALNLVSRSTLLKFGRHVVVGIFILAAIVTPPDFISQCGLAIPLAGLYFVAIFIAKCFGWGKS